ncbi:MAG: hypothetical protein HY083_00020 [Gammaproteobacteria bacterium]|nr:hypothetical protein [Gammaproteobacteria bacterium]
MHAAYNWFLRLLFPYVLLRLLWRGLRNPDYWRRIPERFGLIDPLPTPRVIWIHAVSVGEVRAAVPLVRELSARYPDYPLLITTMTPTGSAQVRELFNGKVGAHGADAAQTAQAFRQHAAGAGAASSRAVCRGRALVPQERVSRRWRAPPCNR